MNTLIIKTTIILLLLMMVASCSNKEAKSSCCSDDPACENTEEVSPPTITEESVYQLSTTWENQHKEKVLLKSNAGKLVVAAMVFTHCPSACPRIVADVKRIEDKLSEKEKEKVKFLLISMDPKGDTPERMAEFAKDHQLGKNWEIIRSAPNATMEIANVLGVRIKPLADGGFDHSNTIHIINRNGEIEFQQHGLNTDPEQSLKHLKDLLKAAGIKNEKQLTNVEM